MTQLEIRKRELLARSDVYRQALSAEIASLQSATAWVSRTLHYARLVAPVLALVVPAAGWAFRGRKKAPPPRKPKGLLAKVIAGYHIARQVKPVWDGYRRARTVS